MQMLFCPNCQKRTGFRRALGFGTFVMVLITFGLWLLVIPLYPARCMTCGLQRQEAVLTNLSVWWALRTRDQKFVVGYLLLGAVLILAVLISSPIQKQQPAPIIQGPDYNKPANQVSTHAINNNQPSRSQPAPIIDNYAPPPDNIHDTMPVPHEEASSGPAVDPTAVWSLPMWGPDVPIQGITAAFDDNEVAAEARFKNRVALRGFVCKIETGAFTGAWVEVGPAPHTIQVGSLAAVGLALVLYTANSPTSICHNCRVCTQGSQQPFLALRRGRLSAA